jgi:hypothetical protein
MWVCLSVSSGQWELSPCPVLPGGRALTPAEAALPWPWVVTDDDGATFRAMTDVEMVNTPKWNTIREKRAPLLDEADAAVNRCRDGVLLGTHTDADVLAAVTYRQTLRDIPQSCADPDDVAWPAKPWEV